MMVTMNDEMNNDVGDGDDNGDRWYDGWWWCSDIWLLWWL